MKNKIDFDVSKPEIAAIVEYYNELIYEIINEYEYDYNNLLISNTLNTVQTKKTCFIKNTILWRTLRYVKHHGITKTIKRILKVFGGNQ